MRPLLPSLSVHDNVLKDPDALRDTLLVTEFKPFDGVDGGHYENTSTEPPFAPLFTPVISRILGHEPDFKLAGWRLDLEGQTSPNHCHADSVYGAEWACVYYMNLPEQQYGGTAFWTHKRTGLDRLPTDESLKAAGFDLSKWHADMTAQTFDEKEWDIAGCVAMRYNRLIIYPTRVWHSRMPAGGFGTDVKNGRLVGVGFFNV